MFVKKNGDREKKETKKNNRCVYMDARCTVVRQAPICNVPRRSLKSLLRSYSTEKLFFFFFTYFCFFVLASTSLIQIFCSDTNEISNTFRPRLLNPRSIKKLSFKNNAKVLDGTVIRTSENWNGRSKFVALE